MNVNEYISSGVIETCILGIADANEMALFEKMRQENNDVHQYALQFETELEQQFMQESVHLPENDNLKNAVFSSVSQPTESAKVVPIATTPKKSIFSKYAVAASIALLLGSLIANFTLLTNIKKQQSEITSLKTNATEVKEFDFLKNPEIVPIAMNGVGVHAICRCSIYWDKKGKKIYFQIHHLMQTADDKAYQLWAMVGGKPVSVGMIKFDGNKQPLTLINTPDNATAFSLTLENATGAATPNEDVYLKGTI